MSLYHRSNPAEKESFEIRCPIHGSIALDDQERTLLDHPLVQRLRHVSQLGLASLVFPSATHSRLAHSLGVMHLAGRIFDQAWTQSAAVLEAAKFTDDDVHYFRQVVRLAALLHDLGHPPFSHACEELLLKQMPTLPEPWLHADTTSAPAIPQAMPQMPQQTSQAISQVKVSHEDYSASMVYAISQQPSMASVFSQKTLAQDVCSLIAPRVHPSKRLRGTSADKRDCIYPFLTQVIAGEIDADRMDYLHRDAYFAGASYGWFDRERLIQGLSCRFSNQLGWVMGLAADSLHAYENFLMARIHMTTQVYHHKTVLSFGECLKQALKAEEITYAIPVDDQGFLHMREDALWELLHQAAAKHQAARVNGGGGQPPMSQPSISQPSISWAERIVYRRPLKRLLHQYVVSKDKNSPPWLEPACQALHAAGLTVYQVHTHQQLSHQGDDHTTPVLVHRHWLGTEKNQPLHQVSSLLRDYACEFAFWGLFYPAEEAQLSQKMQQVLQQVPEVRECDGMQHPPRQPGNPRT